MGFFNYTKWDKSYNKKRYQRLKEQKLKEKQQQISHKKHDLKWDPKLDHLFYATAKTQDKLIQHNNKRENRQQEKIQNQMHI